MIDRHAVPTVEPRRQDPRRCLIGPLSSNDDEGPDRAGDVNGWARNVDSNVPSAARMYDYLLGGMHHFAADREAADKVVELMPDARLIARANRSFLYRAVRFLVACGVRQFVDIGSGIPTRGNVHAVAQRLDPDARVVYIDVDPVAVLHACQMLARNERATAIVGDLRRPQQLVTLLNAAPHGTVVDLARPIALLMISMLNFVPGEVAHQAVSSLSDILVPGSYLVISHPVSEAIDDHVAAKVDAIYQRTTAPSGLRTVAEVRRFFDGFVMVPPGLVWVPQWHPEPGDDRLQPGALVDPRRTGTIAGVGRKTEGSSQPHPASQPISRIFDITCAEVWPRVRTGRAEAQPDGGRHERG